MSNHPAKIFGDKKLIFTRDGSFSFYSLSYGESYKTKSVGAYAESRRKFVEAGKISELFKKGDVRLLDICFGFGMNLAATIEEYLKTGYNHRLHIVSVEKDYSLISLVREGDFLFPVNGYKILRELIKKGRWGNISLELYIDDAISLINMLNHPFNAVYFDPFSAKHNPEMWSVDIFIKMKDLLTFDGVLMTYASNKALREMLAGLGFYVERVAVVGGRSHPSIVVKK